MYRNAIAVPAAIHRVRVCFHLDGCGARTIKWVKKTRNPAPINLKSIAALRSPRHCKAA